jgi:predicted O-methyltransferase YrrM
MQIVRRVKIQMLMRVRRIILALPKYAVWWLSVAWFCASHLGTLGRLPHVLAFVRLLFQVRHSGMMPDDRHRLLLWRAACFPFGEGHVVEIGSYEGGSSVYLARPMCLDHDSYKLYCVDTFTGYGGNEESLPRFWKNIGRAGVSCKVVAIQNTSVDAAAEWTNGSIRLLFIDALHTLEGVRSDFKSWSPFVVEGGGIIFHDYDSQHPGVKQYVDELIAGGTIIPLVAIPSMLMARKALQG